MFPEMKTLELIIWLQQSSDYQVSKVKMFFLDKLEVPELNTESFGFLKLMLVALEIHTVELAKPEVPILAEVMTIRWKQQQPIPKTGCHLW